MSDKYYYLIVDILATHQERQVYFGTWKEMISMKVHYFKLGHHVQLYSEVHVKACAELLWSESFIRRLGEVKLTYLTEKILLG